MPNASHSIVSRLHSTSKINQNSRTNIHSHLGFKALYCINRSLLMYPNALQLSVFRYKVPNYGPFHYSSHVWEQLKHILRSRSDALVKPLPCYHHSRLHHLLCWLRRLPSHPEQPILAISLNWVACQSTSSEKFSLRSEWPTNAHVIPRVFVTTPYKVFTMG